MHPLPSFPCTHVEGVSVADINAQFGQKRK